MGNIFATQWRINEQSSDSQSFIRNEDQSTWEQLPHHLLDDILRRLESLEDCIRFGAVCVAWRSACKFNNAVSRGHQPPLLLIPQNTHKHAFRLYDVSSNKFIGREVYVPYQERFRGSSQGWLLTVGQDCSVTLYRPFSMTNKHNHDINSSNCHTIRLPKFQALSDCFNVKKFVISADPVANANECIVMLIGKNLFLAFLRLGRDSSWTLLSNTVFWGGITDVVILGGNRVYAIKKKGSMISFKIFSDSISNVEVVAPKIPLWAVAEPWDLCQRYLVKVPCSDDLLQVERYFIWKPFYRPRFTVGFRVFKFGGKYKEWVQVTSLGDMCLFVGESSSVSIESSRFFGYKPNCVYFTHDMTVDTHMVKLEPTLYSDLGIGDRVEKRIKMRFSLDSTGFTTERSSPIWVTPTV